MLTAKEMKMKSRKEELTVTEMARKGGKAAAAKLTAKQRTERARKAGLAGGRGRAKKGGTR
jgi:general stress protein YciG